MDWLIVGGAPRSGTTALGDALRKSKEIALLHEYDAAQFFKAVDGFFRESDRLSVLEHFEIHRKYIPNRETLARHVAQDFFYRMFRKRTRVIGTKFPGYYAWESPAFPSWISPKYVHITRNPYECFLSSFKKSGNAEITRTFFNRWFSDWISSWNYMINAVENENFLHLFYSDILQDPDSAELALGEFLDINDFSLCDFKMDARGDLRAQYKKLDIELALEWLDVVIPFQECEEWLRSNLKGRHILGMPFDISSKVRLTSRNDEAAFFLDGFYPPEVGGSWSKGTKSTFIFCNIENYLGPIAVDIEISWVASLAGEGRSVIFALDEEVIANRKIDCHVNGDMKTIISLFIPEVNWCATETHQIIIRVTNPINPAESGASDDNRDLGIMVSSIGICRLGPMI